MILGAVFLLVAEIAHVASQTTPAPAFAPSNCMSNSDCSPTPQMPLCFFEDPEMPQAGGHCCETDCSLSCFTCSYASPLTGQCVPVVTGDPFDDCEPADPEAGLPGTCFMGICRPVALEDPCNTQDPCESCIFDPLSRTYEVAPNPDPLCSTSGYGMFPCVRHLTADRLLLGADDPEPLDVEPWALDFQTLILSGDPLVLTTALDPLDYFGVVGQLGPPQAWPGPFERPKTALFAARHLPPVPGQTTQKVVEPLAGFPLIRFDNAVTVFNITLLLVEPEDPQAFVRVDFEYAGTSAMTSFFPEPEDYSVPYVLKANLENIKSIRFFNPAPVGVAELFYAEQIDASAPCTFGRRAEPGSDALGGCTSDADCDDGNALTGGACEASDSGASVCRYPSIEECREQPQAVGCPGLLGSTLCSVDLGMDAIAEIESVGLSSSFLLGTSFQSFLAIDDSDGEDVAVLASGVGPSPQEPSPDLSAQSLIFLQPLYIDTVRFRNASVIADPEATIQALCAPNDTLCGQVFVQDLSLGNFNYFDLNTGLQTAFNVSFDGGSYVSELDLRVSSVRSISVLLGPFSYIESIKFAADFEAVMCQALRGDQRSVSQIVGVSAPSGSGNNDGLSRTKIAAGLSVGAVALVAIGSYFVAVNLWKPTLEPPTTSAPEKVPLKNNTKAQVFTAPSSLTQRRAASNYVAEPYYESSDEEEIYNMRF